MTEGAKGVYSIIVSSITVGSQDKLEGATIDTTIYVTSNLVMLEKGMELYTTMCTFVGKLNLTSDPDSVFQS